MECTCKAKPHELFCLKATPTLTVGRLWSAIGNGLMSMHESKKVAVRLPNGKLMAVKAIKTGFVRGEFMLVIDAERLR